MQLFLILNFKNNVSITRITRPGLQVITFNNVLPGSLILYHFFTLHTVDQFKCPEHLIKAKDTANWSPLHDTDVGLNYIFINGTTFLLVKCIRMFKQQRKHRKGIKMMKLQDQTFHYERSRVCHPKICLLGKLIILSRLLLRNKRFGGGGEPLTFPLHGLKD